MMLLSGKTLDGIIWLLEPVASRLPAPRGIKETISINTAQRERDEERKRYYTKKDTQEPNHI